MSVGYRVTPAKVGVSGQLRAAFASALTRPGMPAFAGMTKRLRTTRLGRIGLALGTVAGGLVALDLIGLAVTFYFHDEILAQAEAAGLGALLRP